jgi:hypothetical protein
MSDLRATEALGIDGAAFSSLRDRGIVGVADSLSRRGATKVAARL